MHQNTARIFEFRGSTRGCRTRKIIHQFIRKNSRAFRKNYL